MKIFTYLYEKCIALSKHPKASLFLGINSFIESVFWPIPPDVMLIPMCLAKREKALRYAGLAVITSVLGTCVGYYLGYFLYDPYVSNFLRWMNYESYIEVVRNWYAQEYGILMIFIGAFTPVPYKVIAITTGLVAAQSYLSVGNVGMLTIINFIGVSLVGRGLRFYLEVVTLKLGRDRMEKVILKYIDRIGWLCVILLVFYGLYNVVTP